MPIINPRLKTMLPYGKLSKDVGAQITSNETQRSSRSQLTVEHCETLTRYIYKDPSLARLLKDNAGEVFIAGGFPVCCLMATSLGDVDIFGTDRLRLFEAARVYGFFSRGRIIKPTKYSQTVSGRIGDIQFVVKDVYKNAQACIDSFDFSICQAAIWFEDGKWQTVCSPNFYPDFKARRLRFVNKERINEAPGASLWRAAKYTERGFKLSRDDKVALMDRFFQNYQRKKEGNLKMPPL